MADALEHRLDNVGKFYAAQAGSPNQTIFRLAATMVDEVDEQALQRALDAAVAQFPGFNVSLRSGMFWHYPEPSGTAPRVTPRTCPSATALPGPKACSLPRELLPSPHQRGSVPHDLRRARRSWGVPKGAARRLRGRAPRVAEAAACAYAGTEDRQKTAPRPRSSIHVTANHDCAAAGKAKSRAFHLTARRPTPTRFTWIPPIGQRRACRRQRRRSASPPPHRGGHLRRAPR